MRKFIYGIYLVILYSHSAIAQPADTLTLTVVSVNDMHARIDHFPGFISWMDSIRECNEHVLLFSAGDNFTGNPVVDQYPDKGYPMIQLMNLAGFNLSAIGNHEFDYGQETLKRRIDQADFPLMAANIRTEDKGMLQFKPYETLTIEGTKICVFSMVQVNEQGIPDTHPSKLSGLKFIDPLEYVSTLKQELNACDVLIALTHLGLGTDIQLADTWGDIDLINGGHSHTLIKDSPLQNGVLVTQAGAGLKYATVSNLKVVNGKVIDKSARLVDLSRHQGRHMKADSLLAVFNDNDELKRTIGMATAPIVGTEELGHLMTDAIAAVSPIEMAFQNTGGIRIKRLEKGDITIRDVYTLDPFGNEIILLKMTPAEIRSLLLNAYNRNNSVDLIPSGIHYTVITDKANHGTDIRLSLPDGSPLNENQTYNVGISSYVASSYTFDHEDPGTSLFIITAQSVINFIEQKQAINYSGTRRTFVEQK